MNGVSSSVLNLPETDEMGGQSPTDIRYLIVRRIGGFHKIPRGGRS